MAGRIRSVKPEWLEDERLVELDLAARVLSVALLLLADDHGRGRAHASYIGANVFANETDPRGTASRALADLSRIGFVELYTVRGQSYFAIRNWARHQRVDKPGAPRVPPPSEADTTTETPANPEIREGVAKVPEALANDPDALATDLRSRSPSIGGGSAREDRPPPPPVRRLAKNRDHVDAMRDTLALTAALAEVDLDALADRCVATLESEKQADAIDRKQVARELVADIESHVARFKFADADQRAAQVGKKLAWILRGVLAGEWKPRAPRSFNSGGSSDNPLTDDAWENLPSRRGSSS